MRDRVVLVTGAASGLGAAVVERLAADGARVIVNDLAGGPAAEVAARVGGEAAVFDVADPAAVNAAVDAVVARHGRLDGLVNNAGIAPGRPEVSERSVANLQARLTGGDTVPTQACSGLSDELWDRMLRVHLYGTFHCTRAALRHMEPSAPLPISNGRGHRRGAIVNVASIAGLGGLPTAPDYSAAKGGIVAFTQAVATEVAPLGIRVNAVAPAFIDTPLLGFLDPVTRGYIEMRSGAGRLGRAEEVADAVRFLLGDESSYCFGEVLTLTGAFR
jgi:3-oxoacyl-[acyl-carrier protein] reductase